MSVRTTVDLDADVHRRLKVLAAQHGLTLSDLTRALYALLLDEPAVQQEALRRAADPA